MAESWSFETTHDQHTDFFTYTGRCVSDVLIYASGKAGPRLQI